MKQSGGLPLFSGIFVAVSGVMLSAYAVAPIAGTKAAAVKTTSINGMAETLKIVPGRIIVKVKESAAAKAPAASTATSAAGIDARLSATIPAFGSFKKKHPVRLTERLFKQSASEIALTGSDMYADPSAHLSRVKSLFVQRSKRAAGKPAAPRLENIYRITLDRSEDVRAACVELSKDSSVEYAIPNNVSYTQYVPNDPLYSQQWSHTVSCAAQAWDIERGKSGVVVAIVDCGIDYTHEDLAANMLGACGGGCPPSSGYDFVDIDTNSYISAGCSTVPGEDYTTPDNDPMDFNGHGTHCAGIVAAVADNFRGVSGVAPNVKLMPVRAGFSMNVPGYGEVGCLESDDIANAIRYAADNGADVISMSFGGGSDPLQQDAIAYAASLGVVLVAAAGNGNTSSPSYPAGYDNVISVAATGETDNRAYYSNFGSWVDVAAPGGDNKVDPMILSTVPRSGGTLCSSSGYRALQGTSMATPYVAGVAALVLSRDPTRTADDVESIIKRSVDSPQSNEYIGTGRVNVLKAVQTRAVHASVAIESLDRQILTTSITPIAGSIDAAGGTLYKVFIGSGLYPSNWTLLSSGNAPVSHGILASLDAGKIANGQYAIKVVAYAENDSVWATARFAVDHALHTAMPKINSWWSNSSTLSDIDGDGAEEIIIGTSQGIWAIKGNGAVVPGWPVDFTPGTQNTGYTNGITPSPAVADIDNDGIKEVVMVGYSSVDMQDSLYVFSSSGIIKPGFPVPLGSRSAFSTPVTLADLDNDGAMEIILLQKNIAGNTDYFDRMMVFTSNGKPFQKWPLSFNRFPIGGTHWGNGYYSTHVLAFDIDNDGKKELIATACKPDSSAGYWRFLQLLFVFNFDGTIRSGFPIEFPNSFSQNGLSPVVADINNDGVMEIGVVLYEGGLYSQGVFTYVKPDGTVLNGWPQSFPYQLWSTGVSLADIDRDGSIETIFGTYSDTNGRGYVSIYKPDGTAPNSWPVITDAPIQSPTIAADINGDGFPEVIAVDVNGKVYAWTYTGTPVSGFPKTCTVPGYTYAYVNESPSVGDINGDGKLELEVSTDAGETFVWDLSGAANKLDLQWPMDLHDPMHNSDVRNKNKCQAIAIVAQPSNAIVTAPAAATFIVTANGTSPAYQWQISTNNGAAFSDIPGATSRSFTTGPTSGAMHRALYRCKVSNGCASSETSGAALLSVYIEQKLTGAAFGTSPPWTAGREFDKASDANTATFFDYSQGTGGYTGIDLGAGVSKKIVKIRFYPRASFASRMIGGKFQGSSSSISGPYADLYTIASLPASGWNEVTINNAASSRYLRYYGPANGFCNIAEMEFFTLEFPNLPPTVSVAAAAASNPVTGAAVALSVLGSDDGGESNLTYTWATAGAPPAAVTFSDNGANSSKNTTAAFTKAGSYILQATIKDQGGLTATSPVVVTVNPTLSGIALSPSSASITVSSAQQFTAKARDQFGIDLAAQPTFSWSVSGGGTISASGLFVAGPTAGGPFTVIAAAAGMIGKSSVTVNSGSIPIYRINCGGAASSPFTADQYYSGATTYSVTSVISTAGLTNPAPQAVYQTERYGNVTYTFPGLTGAASYKVRLHFSENYWTAAGKRKFNVSINGTTVLSNYDIYAETGAQYKAIVKEYTAVANGSGQIVLKFANVTDNAKIGGIEIIKQ